MLQNIEGKGGDARVNTKYNDISFFCENLDNLSNNYNFSITENVIQPYTTQLQVLAIVMYIPSYS